MDRFDLCHYTNVRGEDLFGRWLSSIKDIRALASIAARLTRLSNGNFGDCKFVGQGVWELRVHLGEGWRIYYGIQDEQLIVLCAGGTKSGQQKDITTAIQRWTDWTARKKS